MLLAGVIRNIVTEDLMYFDTCIRELSTKSHDR